MFDKKLCISNIYFLARKKGLKLGDMERQAGVSTGYISRLNKEDNSTIPGVDFVEAIARMLGVTVDALINYDYENLSPTEEYLITVIEKMTAQTRYSERLWERMSDRSLRAEMLDEEGHPVCPMFSWDTEKKKAMYVSAFDTSDVRIIGTCFRSQMNEDTWAYLMLVGTAEQRDSADGFYELYLRKGMQISPVCCSGRNNQHVIAKDMKELYTAIVDTEYRPKIKMEVKQVLDAFLAEGNGIMDAQIMPEAS